MSGPKRAGDGYAPRGLRLEDAARYVGLGRSKFLDLVKARRLPAAKRIDGCVIWDRLALDDAFDAIPADNDDDRNPWDGATA